MKVCKMKQWDFYVLGADRISEEWRERPANDVREARAVGLHFPELRLYQPGACPDQISQREAQRGWESCAVLWAVHLQWQVSDLLMNMYAW